MLRSWNTRPWRFGLRTLLVGVTLVCILLTVLPHEARRYQQRKSRARQHILSLGGEVEHFGYSTEPSPGDTWLSRMLAYSEGQEKLWAVNLAHCPVAAADLTWLRGCRWIRVLNLSNTKVGNDSLQHIAQCEELLELRLANTRISDAGLSKLKPLQRLTVLDVANTAVTYDGLANLEQFLSGTNLQEQLAISRINIPQLDISADSREARQQRTEFGWIIEAQSARSLHFTSPVAVTEVQIQDLRRLSSARALDAHGVDFPSDGLQFITDLRNLESISFDEGRTGNLRDDDMRWLTRLPKLKSLTIFSSNLSDEALSQIAAIPQLESLEIGGTKLTNLGIAHLSSAVWLRSLTLDGTQLTPALLVHLRQLPRLNDLHLNLWYRGSTGDRYGRPPAEVITDAREAMQYLAEFPSLLELDTRGNLMVAEVLSPVTALGALERLKVDGRYVSREEAMQFEDWMPHCHVHWVRSPKQ